MNAETRVVERESPHLSGVLRVGSRYDRGTTKRAPDRVLAGPQSRALATNQNQTERGVIVMVDDTRDIQPILFEVPSPIVQKVKRKDTGTGKPKYTKYRPIHPLKCDDCMLILALAKGDAPASRQARWRRKTSDTDLLLCQGHTDLRREEDGLPELKGYSA